MTNIDLKDAYLSVPVLPLAPFNLILISKTLTKVTIDQTVFNSRCSSLASPELVAGSSETYNISAIVATDQSNPLNGPSRPEPSSSNVPSPSLGRVSHLYQRFQAESIPSNVADLLIAATRISTHKTYESSWNRWCRWRSGETEN